jgi:hypothetical protein
MKPCQKECHLERGVCTGCGRPIELIQSWRSMSGEEREKALLKGTGDAFKILSDYDCATWESCPKRGKL